MKILITGGAGFIGSHLTEKLLGEGHEITIVDNLNDYYDPTLKESRLARFKDRVTFYRCNITDMAGLEEIFTKHTFDAVCHLAAQAGVRYSLENPFVYAESNYVGTVNVFECAKRHKVSQVVFASTSSVYGKNEKMPFNEEDRVDTPISIYSASKRAGELLAHSYNHLFGLNITCLRFFSVYGPYGRPDMALFLFVKNILEGKPIDVFNNGEMNRDFTYVSDIVSGFSAALTKPLGFSIINLGHGEPVHLKEFIRIIEDELGKKAIMNFLPMQPGDVASTFADTRKAKELLGYKAVVDVEEGVRNFVTWYRDYYKIPTQ